MPRIVAKREVLSGRGAVVLYGSGTSAGSFFYRELIKGSRSYRQRKIPDATSMDEAVQQAVEVAFAMQAEELETPDLVKDIFSPSKTSGSKSYDTTTLLRQPRRQLIEDSITNFLEQERQRKEAGLITSKTRQQKEITLTQHMLSLIHI